MKVNFLTQCPTTPQVGNLQSLLTMQIRKNQLDVAKVVSAYATVSGVRTLLAAFENHGLDNSSWLLGLDDAVTQPGAIDLLLSLEGAEVRVASHEHLNLRFHHKFFLFGRKADAKKLFALIGSTNLTASGLSGNGESAAMLEGQSDDDQRSLNVLWSTLWAQGHKPGSAELVAYKDRYAKAVILRGKYKAIAVKQKVKAPSDILESDDAQLDPSIATTCWIECGNVTAMGRELEFKAEQGLFFGLSPSGGKAKSVSIKVSDEAVLNLRMKYQGNHMWRLQMNNNVPEVRSGLRPKGKNGKLERSPFVAVFTRGIGSEPTSLKFIHLKDLEFARLRKQTAEIGTLGKTIAREYGWC